MGEIMTFHMFEFNTPGDLSTNRMAEAPTITTDTKIYWYTAGYHIHFPFFLKKLGYSIFKFKGFTSVQLSQRTNTKIVVLSH